MTGPAYIRRETRVSIVINTVLSALFFLAVFGNSASVPVWGSRGYVLDFGPQGFMIGLMATLVPGALARRALRSGTIDPVCGSTRMPRGLLLRGVSCGVAGAVAGIALSGAGLTLAGLAQLPWWPALLVKLAFGFVLAALITPAGLRAELIAR